MEKKSGRKSASKRREDQLKRFALRWACIRLNPEYRRFYDRVKSKLPRDTFRNLFKYSVPIEEIPSKIPDQKPSLKIKCSRNVFTPSKYDREASKRWSLPWAVSYEEGDYFDGIKKRFGWTLTSSGCLFDMIGKSSPADWVLPSEVTAYGSFKKPDQTPTWAKKVYENGFGQIKFRLTASKEDIERAVDEAFHNIERFKKTMRLGKNSKTGALMDALSVYWQIKYGGKIVKQIAKAEKDYGRNPESARRRIEERNKTAKRYVEFGDYRSL